MSLSWVGYHVKKYHQKSHIPIAWQIYTGQYHFIGIDHASPLLLSKERIRASFLYKSTYQCTSYIKILSISKNFPF